ncbi:MAG: YdiU family protein [Desulfobacterales bacterium]|nr:YdiU family protein [Desulfobacterales bacterium]
MIDSGAQTLTFPPEITVKNDFTDQLPEDPNPANTRRQVTGACYSRVSPTRVKAPALVAYSREAAKMLGLSDSFCRSDEFVRIFSGNQLVDKTTPYAMCYGGHQFGSWAGQLGDGRAINLGEIHDPDTGRWTLQLKGAGPTPYSRTADGLAVLRSSIREFLCSEAMYHLGVPTTRALSLILTGEEVERDMFYDGHPKMEPGAVVCRISPSFIRFGSFEIFSARNELNLLKKLADYTIRTDFPHLGEPGKETYIRWFREICRTTAEMIVHWMRVGFVHGVMNTDNMSILGLTIDYGPYGWLENFDPSWTPNTTDARTRRYCFGNQPGIAQWNLAQLGNALFPLIKEVEPLQEGVDLFRIEFEKNRLSMMAQKLGIDPFDPSADTGLIIDLLELLPVVETDMTLFFRNLSKIDLSLIEKPKPDMEALAAPLSPAWYRPEQKTPAYMESFNRWLNQYARRCRQQTGPVQGRRDRMDRVNPKYVLRNYLAQQAIEKAETGDFSMVRDLLDLVRHPYDEQPGKEIFAKKRPDWARTKPGCSMLSCSS